MKNEGSDDLIYFAIVDVINLHSQLVIIGESEQNFAEKAFQTITNPQTGILNLGQRVSRKKTMVPPLDALIKSGWRPKGSLNNGSPLVAGIRSADIPSERPAA